MIEGQYIYSCGSELLGSKLEIRRAVLLRYDKSRYEIGDSREPNSVFESGFIGSNRYLEGWADTPVEAVNKYIEREYRYLTAAIQANKNELVELERKLVEIRKVDHTKLKIKKYPDDWVPCDF